jgi:hypothetical protein
MSLTWPGIIKLIPARESLVSDIPAGDGKSLTFFTVYVLWLSAHSLNTPGCPGSFLAFLLENLKTKAESMA